MLAGLSLSSRLSWLLTQSQMKPPLQGCFRGTTVRTSSMGRARGRRPPPASGLTRKEVLALLGEPPPRPPSGGVKHDAGKLRWSLLPPAALQEVIKVFEHGAAKYGEGNWQKGLMFVRCFDAMQRHLWAWREGQDVDAEGGFQHLAAVAFYSLTMLEYQAQGKKGLDDRKDMLNLWETLHAQARGEVAVEEGAPVSMYTKCASGEACLWGVGCYRHAVRANESWQSWADFTPVQQEGESCENYISAVLFPTGGGDNDKGEGRGDS